jgi:hypothetical protein
LRATLALTMLAGLVDHLWQSLVFGACIVVIAHGVRRYFAPLRLWLWRLAAVKFVFPFALLFAAGETMGLPATHTADPVPAELAAANAALAHLVTPARTSGRSGMILVVALLAGSACAFGLARLITRQWMIERETVRREEERLVSDVDAFAPRPGFVLSLMFTLCAAALIGIPLLAGAVEDRQRHLEHLALNSLALRHAELRLTESTPGSGGRYQIDADAGGVTVRHVNVRTLVALAYGINYYAVLNDQLNWEPDAQSNSWFLAPFYDLHATAKIPVPENFDSYALRQPVTKLLGERFGLQIELNGDCQPPCGTYGVPLSEDPLEPLRRKSLVWLR